MCQNPEEQITAAAAKAKTLLSQLGPLVWALHANQGAVIPTALCVDLEPDACVAIGTDEPPEQQVKRKDAVVKVLRKLKEGRDGKHPELFTSAGYRDAVNRTIVVYAVAVLEQFLDDAGREVYKRRGGDESKWPDSFRARVGCLKRVGIGLHDREHYSQAALLALYRHKIVHVDARVDGRLLEDVAKIENESGKELRFCLSEDESSVVWVSCGGKKLCCAWTCKSISLAIDEVVLPLLSDAQAFVGEAAEKLREGAGNCPTRGTT